MDFDDFLSRARVAVDASARANGHARYPGDATADLYGTAAAVGILIALGETPTGDDAHGLAEAVQSFQRPDGTFRDETHGEHHRAATALTTLSILGRKPAAPQGIAPLLRAEAAAAFLDGLDWANPWPASHDAAGVLAVGMVTSAPDPEERRRWVTAYLEWLDANVDPVTGLWRAGRMGALHDEPGLFGNLGCSFHIHFLYERLGREWPHAAGVVDVGLRLYGETDSVVGRGADEWGFRQLDWAYSVGRAARASHRLDEVDAALEDLADRAAVALADPASTRGDLHVLQARVGLAAELAQRLPGRVGTGGRTLTSIVDVRPFI